MSWTVNILFFLIPSAVTILMFIAAPYINRKNEPFGYKTKNISKEFFVKVNRRYLKNVLIFSLPLCIAVSLLSVFFHNAITGSLVLILFIVMLIGINMVFYINGYKKIKNHLQK